MKLRKQIETAINSVSAENGSNTPDFILAEFLSDCLSAFDRATKAREKWYGLEMVPTQYGPGCRGVPAQPATPEPDADPRNPNVKTKE